LCYGAPLPALPPSSLKLCGGALRKLD
jgi:hypothetical protein